MNRGLKLTVYRACRLLGLFGVARLITRRGLRILCYHGFSFADESDFRPGLFIRPETFARRMRHLAAHGYPVLTLQEAHRRLGAGDLPSNAVVITIDDGFYGVGRLAAPILKQHGFPSTLYVTSYYALKGSPVFRLVVQYMFWKTAALSLDTQGLGLPQAGTVSVRGASGDDSMWEIIRFGETRLSERERITLCVRIGQRLGVDYDTIAASRLFSLLTSEELRALALLDVDIQLHTHRHQLPEDQAQVDREICDNRRFMEPLAASPLAHFCYPSGIWSARQWPWLSALDVATATTCDPGLNYPTTPPFGLRRFLDGEDISQIEFEAEVSGFSELLRRLRARMSLQPAFSAAGSPTHAD